MSLAGAVRLRNFLLYAGPVFLAAAVALDFLPANLHLIELRTAILSFEAAVITLNMLHHCSSYSLFFLPEFRGMFFTEGRPNRLLFESLLVHTGLTALVIVVFVVPFPTASREFMFVTYLVLLQLLGQLHIGQQNLGLSLLINQGIPADSAGAPLVSRLMRWERIGAVLLPMIFILPFALHQWHDQIPLSREFREAFRLTMGLTAVLAAAALVAQIFRYPRVGRGKAFFGGGRWLLMALGILNPFGGQMENLVHAVEHHLILFFCWKRSTARRKALLFLAGLAACGTVGILVYFGHAAMLFRNEIWGGRYNTRGVPPSVLGFLAFSNFWALGHYYVSARIFRFGDPRVRAAGVPQLFQNFGL